MLLQPKDKLRKRPELGDCRRCPLRKRPAVVVRPVPGAKLALLGEGPGPIEEEKGDFFVGPTGRFMQRQVARWRLPWTSVHRDNVLLCRPDGPMEEADWRKAVACCRPRLERTMAGQQTILALGKRAMQAVVQRGRLFDWAGAPMKGVGAFKEADVIITPHVAYALRGKRAFLPVIAIHTQRAVQLAKGELEPWHWPEIIIEPGGRMLAALQGFQREKRRLAVDIEDPEGVLCAIGIGHRDLVVSSPWDGYITKKYGEQGELCLLPYGPEIGRTIVQILRDPTIPKTFQNGRHDILGLRERGFEVAGYQDDVLDINAVAAPQLPHKLGFIAGIETNAEAWKTEYRTRSDLKGSAIYGMQDPTKLRVYNGKDVAMTDVLTDIGYEQLDQTHRGRELYQQLMELTRKAMEMTDFGVAVDEEARAKHHVALQRKVLKARSDLAVMAEHMGLKHFNPSSNRQIASLLMGRLHVRPTKFSEKTGAPSFDEEVLSELASLGNTFTAAFAQGLLQYRRWTTLFVKYVRDLPVDKRKPVHLVHPLWKPHSAITGRWGCDSPNLHNIPKPVEEYIDGAKQAVYPGLRDMYIPRPGHVLVKGDYRALELRIVAMLSGAVLLLDWFANERDVHNEHAVRFFGKGDKDYQVSKHERTRIKNLIYNACYLGSDETIWKLLRTDIPDLKLSDVVEMMRWIFSLHREVPRWQKRVVKYARKRDYVEETFSGRRRHFYKAVEDTEAVNFGVQALAAKIMNDAFLRLWDELDDDERIIIQCHDELVCEGPNAERLVEKMRGCMETELSYNGNAMRFTIDLAIGPSWGNTKEIGHV